MLCAANVFRNKEYLHFYMPRPWSPHAIQKVEIGNSSVLLGFLVWASAYSGPARLIDLVKSVRGKHLFSGIVLGCLDQQFVLKCPYTDSQVITGKRAFLELCIYCVLQTPRKISLLCPPFSQKANKKKICSYLLLLTSAVL